jgi:hypothetical protein
MPSNGDNADSRARRELYRRATAEWEILKNTHLETWDRYRVIGEAMVDARAEIMRRLEINQPYGRGYQQAMAEWLEEHKLDDMHKTTRSKLCELVDHIDEVEEMMNGDGSEEHPGWTLDQRMKWNSPVTIHRRLQAWRKGQGITSGQQRRQLSDAQQLREELEMAQKRIIELEEELAGARERAEGGGDNLAEVLQQRQRPEGEPGKSFGLGTLSALLGGPGTPAADPIISALNTLVSGAVRLDDVLLGGFEPVDLIALAKDLNDIAAEMKRRKRQASNE